MFVSCHQLTHSYSCFVSSRSIPQPLSPLCQYSSITSLWSYISKITPAPSPSGLPTASHGLVVFYTSSQHSSCFWTNYFIDLPPS
ncbi:hypothetical protein PHET_10814 [Paragonimus heterotremus]|uniref:Uncharacterized protein n=1 Tax=Paragonimus heterotremus TaxID=100268 RepID=A0A8J4SG37_9TREM|nr:hypothetical protein PHET_10814 [Paragonimus heterotremus]